MALEEKYVDVGCFIYSMLRVGLGLGDASFRPGKNEITRDVNCYSIQWFILLGDYTSFIESGKS